MRIGKAIFCRLTVSEGRARGRYGAVVEEGGGGRRGGRRKKGKGVEWFFNFKL